MNTILRHDDNGRVTYRKYCESFEYWYEYNGENITTRTVFLRGGEYDFEEISTVDGCGNLVYYRDRDGLEMKQEFDKNGNLVYKINKFGCEFWQEYDEQNNKVHYRNSNGNEFWKEYNENNNTIHFKNSDGNEEWYKWINNEQISITQSEFEQIKKQLKKEIKSIKNF